MHEKARNIHTQRFSQSLTSIRSSRTRRGFVRRVAVVNAFCFDWWKLKRVKKKIYKIIRKKIEWNTFPVNCFKTRRTDILTREINHVWVIFNPLITRDVNEVTKPLIRTDSKREPPEPDLRKDKHKFSVRSTACGLKSFRESRLLIIDLLLALDRQHHLADNSRVQVLANKNKKPEIWMSEN